ncbi:hypothetical protein [Flavobacterium cerinum]|uniref:DUF3575 domain-containing protein n=1 Tax=Flavobacterium cerinum TaxID=2502784 RepID=A0A3S3SDW3_9FLAO|nr:hypothetical protein [Flavobacterium cerinum]RWW99572.1 hypothetical protein EPI11_11505 [Flavobacterium cerinum]
MFIKKLYTALVFLMAFGCMNAQETTASVEKSLFNIQTGVGIWASHEGRLANQWALRTEVGLDMWSYEIHRYNSLAERETGIFFAPSISVEPRWYYNLQKRADNGRHTSNNSANFLTVAVKYSPDWFKTSGPDDISLPNQISFVPKWGIRRAIAKSSFNYELGAGLGPIWYLSGKNGLNDSADIMFDIHLRIGYTF